MTSRDSLGPFFALEGLLDEACGESRAWSPLDRDLTDPAFVDVWVGRAWARVGGGRVASASDRRALGAVLHLGVVARLTSPWIARFLRDGDTRVPELGELWWRDDGTTMFPLACRALDDEVDSRSLAGSVRRADVGTSVHCALAADSVKHRAPEAFACDLVERLIAPMNAAGFTDSAAIRRGNAVSAVNTAVGLVIRSSTPSAPCGEVGRHLVELCAALLGQDAPAMTGEVLSPTFRRTSCCLTYALPGVSRAAVCGDCVLRS